MIGGFVMKGRYEVDKGVVSIHKAYPWYLVFYSGYAEIPDRGIWGLRELPDQEKGGFHLWPAGMADPTGPELKEEAGLGVDEEVVLIEG